MGTATIALCFTLDGKTFDSEEAHELYQTIPNICFEDNAELQTVCDCGERGDKMITATSDNGSHLVIHLYHFAYLTVDITFVVENIKQLKPLSEPYNIQFIKELEKNIGNHLGEFVKKTQSIPCAIRRAPGITWTYGQTGDERLFETDYEETVFETDSRWQNIKIMKSREFGNVLLLDNDIMLGESDLVYTETLLGIGRNEFKDKTILILGGGDGGILHELLKQSPAYVLMAEIDEEVIKACSKHMKKVCGNTLEKWEGNNYKIKICDCLCELKEALDSGTQYDYVINDLTEFPVDKDKYGFTYQFQTSCEILELSVKILRPGGKYLARGNCLSAENYTNQFEQDVRTLGLDFKRTDVHVPSFLETYCLYEVRKQQDINGHSG
uniref:Spermine synthase-like isoform X1 n=1 Tax=Crassostrea virginica TaxID=6565 RepID=A0A8B8AY96_CRAVI|nr:spermine synthase-like isoform X1 [Crassostrea virginica]XP_022296146.1 spermine synthase-like isoform X1 [Crassostrea virginica]XP_022296147.1 spermine synthase-like isoform X1 [Crassostrea virginica]